MTSTKGGHVSRTQQSARLYLIAFAITIASAVSAHAAAVSTIHIDNFGQVTPTYYRGGQPHGSDFADLASLGVKTIVNLTSDDARADEPILAAKAGIRYVQIPMTTHATPTSAQIDQFLQIVNDPVNQPVYVHCVGGRHRTGVMTAVFRMTTGWTADQAFKEMKQYKFGADFLHPEFKAFVYGYQQAVAPPQPVLALQVPGLTGAAASAAIHP